MKSLLYCISIILIAAAVSSCSKKEDDNNRQTQSVQEQVAETQETEQKSNIQIVPIPSQETLTLNAAEMVEILKKIGFTDSQIQEHAFSIRDGLAKSGAVRILINDEVEAGFAIKGDEVFISSRSRGQHIYNINTGWVNTLR